MITVRREWMAKDGLMGEAVENANEYREIFDPSSSWRIYTPNSGKFYAIIVEEDYESLADAEEKWAERNANSEFWTWHEEWSRVAVDSSLVFNYFNLH